jgi:hypothetical protein
LQNPHFALFASQATQPEGTRKTTLPEEFSAFIMPKPYPNRNAKLHIFRLGPKT